MMNRRLLKDNDIREAMRLAEAGVSSRKIASMIGISRSSVDNIRKGKYKNSGSKHNPCSAPNMPADYGTKIEGSKQYRNYCRKCGAPGRTLYVGYWVCECKGKVVGYDARRVHDSRRWAEVTR